MGTLTMGFSQKNLSTNKSAHIIVHADCARIAAAIDILSGALGPWIAKTLAPRLPAGASWTRLLAAKDARPDKQYRADDLQCQLRILTERMGDLGFPFSGVLSRGEQNLAGELRDVRNAWAHNAPFNADDTYRALDTAERLLRAIGAPESAGRVHRLGLGEYTVGGAGCDVVLFLNLYQGL